MELLVKRTTPTLNTTIGSFYVNGIFESYCLEPCDRGLTSNMTLVEIQKIKIPGVTCQPTGRFLMDWYYSPDHKVYLPRVLQVPDFEDDEVHIGNFKSDTKACLLLGTTFGKDEVLNSKIAIDHFYPQFKSAWDKNEPVHITYEREYTLPIKYQ